MTENKETPPFERRVVADQEGILGAQWWQEELSVTDTEARRQALTALAVLGGLAAVGIGANALVNSEEDSELDALTLQRERGWNYGSTGEVLDFPNPSGPAPSAAEAAALAADLAPRGAANKPSYVPTLFQVLTPGGPAETRAASNQLLSVVRPIRSGEMETARRAGEALADVLRGVDGMLVVVDLPGPQSVAWAAGMAGTFDPIFVFENWPHPRGVVPSHHTLGAALHHHADFTTAATLGTGTGTVLVLDRNRLNPVRDSTLQFDNRYAARVPTPKTLDAMGVKHVLYVSSQQLQELDDLNDVFVDWARSGRTVKMTAATDYWADPASGRFYYGGSPSTHEGFWLHHTWGRAAAGGATTSTAVSLGHEYKPVPRATMFGQTVPSPSGYARVRPSHFGMAPVVVAAGVVTGVRYGIYRTRSSFFRFHGFSGG